MTPVVTLLTDFGTRDVYVGVMKAVITARAPAVRFVDLTHEISPQNVRQAAWALAEAFPWCEPGTIHLAVVDPGVGTARRAVVVQTSQGYLVGPDNGLFTRVLEAFPALGAWHLTKDRFFLPRQSATFHGRDIFAPVVAHLANGVSPDALGDPVDPQSLHRLPLPLAHFEGDHGEAEVVYVDRFGNLVTNLHVDSPESLRVRGVHAAQRWAPRLSAYGDGPVGSLLSLWGSTGHLEISVNQGDAAATLGVREGVRVQVRLDAPSFFVDEQASEDRP